MRKPLSWAAMAVAAVLTLSACSDSDDPVVQQPDPQPQPDPDPEPPAELTTFAVSLQLPDSLLTTSINPRWSDAFIKQAYAIDGSDLSAENIAVAIVDSAGNVVEVVELTADQVVFDEASGNWLISVDGDPRFDCVVVFDLDGAPAVQQGAPLPDDSVYAPTTALTVDVDLASTAAYQQFLDSIEADISFADLGLDPTNAADVAQIEALVNEVQEQFEQLIADNNIDISGFSDLDALIAAVSEVVDEVVDEAIADLDGSSETTVAAEYGESGTGLYYFESYLQHLDWLEQGGYQASFDYGVLDRSKDAYAEYDFEQMGWGELVTYGAEDADGPILLTANGWEPSADVLAFASTNDDGSVTFNDILSGSAYVISSDFSVDLAGRDMMDFLSVRPSTQTLSNIIDDDSEFSAGDRAYRVNDGWAEDTYLLFFDDGQGLAATIVDANGDATATVPETLASLQVSADSEGVAGALLVPVVAHGDSMVAVKLLNDDGLTAQWYELLEDGSNSMLASGSYSAMESNGETLWTSAIPDGVASSLGYELELDTLVLSVYDGVVHLGTMIPASQREQTWTFNQSAGMAIIDAANFVYVDQFGISNDNACLVESEYYDDAYDGLGGPTAETAYSFRAYERVVELCQANSDSAQDFTEALISGKQIALFDGEIYTFNADGTGSVTEPEMTLNFNWQVDDGYLVLGISNVQIPGESGTVYTLSDEERFAIVGRDGTSYDLRGLYRLSVFTEIGAYEGDEPLDPSQGEIYSLTVIIPE